VIRLKLQIMTFVYVLSLVNILTRDIDIGIRSVRLSVRHSSGTVPTRLYIVDVRLTCLINITYLLTYLLT